METRLGHELDIVILHVVLCLATMYLCVAHLFTMIIKAENIDINSQKMKRLVNKQIQEIGKEI